MSLKLYTSIASDYAFISRFDSAIDLGPTPDVGEPPTRLDGESDAAFRARAEVWAAPVREWERPLTLARETGDYTKILKPGEAPTIFKLRQLTASTWAKIDRYVDGLSDRERAQLVVRCAVVGVEGLPLDKAHGPAVDKARPDLGPIRTEAFIDLFTGHDSTIVEIASHAYDRRKSPGN